MLFEKTIQNINRVRQIVQLLIKYGFEDVVVNTPLKSFIPRTLKRKWKHGDKEVTDLSRWERIRMIMEELGPTYIKFGQVLSNRPDLLPPELLEEFEKLQNHVPPFDTEKAKHIIQNETGKKISELFTKFDSTPLASASIGQVHKAQLKNGDEVVVKVQRPDIKIKIDTDISILKMIAHRGKPYFDKAGITNLEELIHAFERTMSKELDYKIEARNLEEFRKVYKKQRKFLAPKPYKEFTTERVLVTEFINGCKITDVKQLNEWGLNPEKLAEIGVNLYLMQIFEFGFFHADPHPGNILVRPDGKICLIDFGMVGRISKRDKFAFANIVIGMAQGDARKAASALRRLSFEDDITNRRQYEYDLAEIIEDFASQDVGDSDMSEMGRRLQKLIYDYKMRVPGSIFLILRSFAILEGVGKTIHPSFNAYDYMRPFGVKILKEMYSADNILDQIWHRLTSFDDFFRSFPPEFTEILKKTRKGELELNINHRGHEDISRTINSGINRIVLTFIIASLILGSAITFTADFGPNANFFGVPYVTVPALMGLSAAGILCLVLLFAVFRSRNR